MVFYVRSIGALGPAYLTWLAWELEVEPGSCLCDGPPRCDSKIKREVYIKEEESSKGTLLVSGAW